MKYNVELSAEWSAGDIVGGEVLSTWDSDFEYVVSYYESEGCSTVYNLVLLKTGEQVGCQSLLSSEMASTLNQEGLILVSDKRKVMGLLNVSEC